MLQVTSCCGSLYCEMSESQYHRHSQVLYPQSFSGYCTGEIPVKFALQGEKDFLQPLSGFSLFQKDIRELLPLLHS